MNNPPHVTLAAYKFGSHQSKLFIQTEGNIQSISEVLARHVQLKQLQSSLVLILQVTAHQNIFSH